MKVIVDTTVWSLALRRNNPDADSGTVAELKKLIQDFRVATIGSIRQELLSGIRHVAQFEELREKLRAFPDLLLTAADFEVAAQFFNQCRAKGVQGSNTDFLICAVAARRDMSIFTTDMDFMRFHKYLGVKLHMPI
ncbi:MAG: PIN domain-containing protein [Sulfuricella sp.]|nr:PIN domain-containing protein [Sulfuricella sp.]